MDELDKKLNEAFPGKVVRKDLLHDVKKAANVPSFVLEFLLAKYCATNDPEEIEAGKVAVIEVIEKNYVRPDESNKAQSTVQQRGKHKFIDKVHVKYYEGERRHWASMENFGSNRIAISEKHYQENEKLLEGGIWAEVTIAHNDIEEDSYAFYIEDLKPIQLARFDVDRYFKGREYFTTDEWIDVLLRSVGLNPKSIENPPKGQSSLVTKGKRLKFHFLARLIPLVQANFNSIELGPRSTGKSHFYSEFSPYSTLFSGGQASTATLLYNNARKKVGAVGFWDNIGFDEVGKMKIKDNDTIQIMKDYMAKGRFSRGQEVNAFASFSFVGNIDHSIKDLVISDQHDLFITLPQAFDLAVQDRLFNYIPGWELPKMSNEFYANSYGLITDYMAEAFHHLAKHSKDYFDIVNRRLKLGSNAKGRDEQAIQKTTEGLIKLIHPHGEPTDKEFEEIVEYAVEGRRRVKEQMNKRKPDDEFEGIDLSFFKSDGSEVIVYCPESRNNKVLQATNNNENIIQTEVDDINKIHPTDTSLQTKPEILHEKRIDVMFGDTGYGYETLFKDYLVGATEIILEDPYIRQNHQIQNFIKFCEVVAKVGDAKKIILYTWYDDESQKIDNELSKFDPLINSLFDNGIELTIDYRGPQEMHERFLRLNNGWTIRMGKGLDYFQKFSGNYYQLGVSEQDLRVCLQTSFDFYKEK